MKNFLCIFLITTCISSSAQKCKYDFEKKDAFTGKTTVAIYGNLTKFWSMSVSTNGDVYSLNVGLLFNGIKNEVINKGDTLMFAFESGTPLVVVADAKFLPSPTASGASIYTRYQPNYTITKEQLLQLSQHNPISFRIYFGRLAASDDLKPKYAEKIRQASTCILNRS